MRVLEAGPLVEPDLSCGRDPTHACRGIVVEQDSALERDSPGQLERCVAEDDQVDTIGEPDVPRSWRVRCPPGSDVDVRVRSIITSRTASEEERELGAGRAQPGDHDVEIGFDPARHAEECTTTVDSDVSDPVFVPIRDPTRFESARLGSFPVCRSRWGSSRRC